MGRTDVGHRAPSVSLKELSFSEKEKFAKLKDYSHPRLHPEKEGERGSKSKKE